VTPEVGIALRRSSADANRAVLCGMEIGTCVLWNGRVYYLRGWDPMGVPDRRADLEDAETGAHAVAPLAEVLPFADEGDASEGGG
jgi:hypothetical protein